MSNSFSPHFWCLVGLCAEFVWNAFCVCVYLVEPSRAAQFCTAAFGTASYLDGNLSCLVWASIFLEWLEPSKCSFAHFCLEMESMQNMYTKTMNFGLWAHLVYFVKGEWKQIGKCNWQMVLFEFVGWEKQLLGRSPCYHWSVTLTFPLMFKQVGNQVHCICLP